MYTVNLVVDNLPVSGPTLKVISENDSTPTKLKDTIKSGWPEKRSEIHQELKGYWKFCDELSEARGLTLIGDKIVIPASLRKETLEKINSSCLGMVRCKQRARNVLLWQGMKKDNE